MNKCNDTRVLWDDFFLFIFFIVCFQALFRCQQTHYKYTDAWWRGLTKKRPHTQTWSRKVLTWRQYEIKINSSNVRYISRQVDVSPAIFKEIWLLLSAISTLLETASSDQGLSFSSYESPRGLTLLHTVISPSYESDCWWMQDSMRGFHGVFMSRQLRRNSKTFFHPLYPKSRNLTSDFVCSWAN